jgi:hypothetical protein
MKPTAADGIAELVAIEAAASGDDRGVDGSRPELVSEERASARTIEIEELEEVAGDCCHVNGGEVDPVASAFRRKVARRYRCWCSSA